MSFLVRPGDEERFRQGVLNRDSVMRRQHVDTIWPHEPTVAAQEQWSGDDYTGRATIVGTSVTLLCNPWL